MLKGKTVQGYSLFLLIKLLQSFIPHCRWGGEAYLTCFKDRDFSNEETP